MIEEDSRVLTRRLHASFTLAIIVIGSCTCVRPAFAQQLIQSSRWIAGHNFGADGNLYELSPVPNTNPGYAYFQLERIPIEQDKREVVGSFQESCWLSNFGKCIYQVADTTYVVTRCALDHEGEHLWVMTPSNPFRLISTIHGLRTNAWSIDGTGHLVRFRAEKRTDGAEEWVFTRYSSNGLSVEVRDLPTRDSTLETLWPGTRPDHLTWLTNDKWLSLRVFPARSLEEARNLDYHLRKWLFCEVIDPTTMDVLSGGAYPLMEVGSGSIIGRLLDYDVEDLWHDSNSVVLLIQDGIANNVPPSRKVELGERSLVLVRFSLDGVPIISSKRDSPQIDLRIVERVESPRVRLLVPSDAQRGNGTVNILEIDSCGRVAKRDLVK